jgi:hypothetical protein
MLAITLSGACSHRTVRVASSPLIMVPTGLHSAQTETWIARQRQACPGRFAIFRDLGVFAVQCGLIRVP